MTDENCENCEVKNVGSNEINLADSDDGAKGQLKNEFWVFGYGG